METMMEVLDSFKGLKNSTIIDNIIKAWTIINNRGFERIGCSISGGSDSDIMLDIVHKWDKDKKVRYFWFDTGLEYQATKDHLEEKEKQIDGQLTFFYLEEWGMIKEKLVIFLLWTTFVLAICFIFLGTIDIVLEIFGYWKEQRWEK